MNTIDTDRSVYESYRGWSVGLGVLMIILGLICISFAAFTTWLSIITLGIVIAVRGVVDIVTAFSPGRRRGIFWHLFGGILAIAIGFLVMFHPGLTTTALTYFIATFLVILGLFKAIAAPVEHRANWGWVMLSGIISLAFGIWIIGAWPEISFFLIGLLVGIEILIQGVVMVALPYTVPHPRKSEAYAH